MDAAAGTALLFPGQGTEAVGMSRGWESHRPWAEALDAAEACRGYALRRWMREGPEAELRAPGQAAYAVVAHSVGVYRTHRAAGLALPSVAAGHSLGLFSAVVAAGVVPLEAALALIDAVEEASAAAFGPGSHGMAFVIGLGEGELREALAGHSDLVLSNLNGKAQFTVSGPRSSLEALLGRVGSQALKAGLLPVQHPLHGPHMVPLLPGIARRMAAWHPRDPDFPVLSFATGRSLETGDACWDETLASVGLPVVWPTVVEGFKARSARGLECGSGTQLANLTRWADRAFPVESLQAPPAQP